MLPLRGENAILIHSALNNFISINVFNQNYNEIILDLKSFGLKALYILAQRQRLGFILAKPMFALKGQHNIRAYSKYIVLSGRFLFIHLCIPKASPLG
jgi:hypothetical protein